MELQARGLSAEARSKAAIALVGGQGHVAYPMLGDAVNTGSRLEGLAPPGGVLIGSATYARLPDGVVVEERRHLKVKGKEEPVGAYVLVALP